MAKVKLKEFAFARSGDKGDGSNVGVFVTNRKDYDLIRYYDDRAIQVLPNQGRPVSSLAAGKAG